MRRATKLTDQVGTIARAEAKSKLIEEKAKLVQDKRRVQSIDQAGAHNHFSEAMLHLFRGVISDEQGRKT